MVNDVGTSGVRPLGAGSLQLGRRRHSAPIPGTAAELPGLTRSRSRTFDSAELSAVRRLLVEITVEELSEKRLLPRVRVGLEESGTAAPPLRRRCQL